MISWYELRIKEDLLFKLMTEKFIEDTSDPYIKHFNQAAWTNFKKRNKIKNYKGPAKQVKFWSQGIDERDYSEDNRLVVLNPFYGWSEKEKFAYISIPLDVSQKLVGKQYILNSFRNNNG